MYSEGEIKLDFVDNMTVEQAKKIIKTYKADEFWKPSYYQALVLLHKGE